MTDDPKGHAHVGEPEVDPFDEKASTWDADPAHVERAAAVARCIAEQIPLDPSTRLLEYGAGTALVAQELSEQVGSLTLADTSQGMRDVIQSKIDAGLLGEARIWDLDLSKDPAPDERFDLVATVLTLHHVVDVGPVLAGFYELIQPGGHLCIVDLDKEDGSFHGDGFAGHHGFVRAALGGSLSAAGFCKTTFSDCYHIVRDGVSYPLFLATAEVGP